MLPIVNTGFNLMCIRRLHLFRSSCNSSISNIIQRIEGNLPQRNLRKSMSYSTLISDNSSKYLSRYNFTAMLPCRTTSVFNLACNNSRLISNLYGYARCAEHSIRRYSSASKIGADEVYREQWTKMCGCCGLHTEGDKKLEQYLNSELCEELEQDSRSSQYQGLGLASKLDPPDGFELISSLNSSAVVLTCRHGNEIITVRTNINDSFVGDSLLNLMNESSDDSDSDQSLMLSRPKFTIELQKQQGGGLPSLCLSCIFISTDDLHNNLASDSSYAEDDTPPIEIEELTLLMAGQKWSSSSYAISNERMDQKLYNALMELLIERGIDARFAEEFIRFCTAFERYQYLSLLERLRNFISCK